MIFRNNRQSISVAGGLYGAVHNLQPVGENITLNMMKRRVVRLLATVLTALGLLVVLLQPPDGNVESYILFSVRE